MLQGHLHVQQADPELAFRAFNSALDMCECLDFPNSTRYRQLVIGELGYTNRCFGRYEQTRTILEKALAGMGHSQQRVEFNGELGVVYRHMNRLPDAKRAFQMQYDSAN